jgi:hypothetical protein
MEAPMKRLACAALLLFTPLAARAGDTAILKAKMQALMDSLVPGDRAPWRKTLDPAYVAIDENGEAAGRDQAIAEVVPLPKGASGSIAVTEFKAHFFRDSAVTTGLDDEHENFHGQKLHALYRFTATWVRKAGDWKLAAMQTIALQQDPPAVELPAVLLESYAGHYRAGTDYAYTISLKDGRLYGAVNDGKQAELEAELADVLFTPGQPRTRKIFQRDANGKVTGFLSRREERDLVFKKE